MAEILYGVRKVDGKTISISDILALPNPDIMRGKRCECICPNPLCGNPLLAKLGKGINLGGREPHFSHFPDFDGVCDSTYANETALHIMAKEIIAEELYFIAPNEEIPWQEAHIVDIPSNVLDGVPAYIHPIGDKFNCSSVSLEKRLHGIVPDIVASTSLGEFLIEISVTHPVTVEKKAKVAELQVPMIEIDLSEYKDKPITKNVLRDILLRPDKHTHWIYYRNKPQVLLDAQNYYRNHPLVSTYIQAVRKREAELQAIYAKNTAHIRKPVHYNPQYYYQANRKSKHNKNVVNASNMKEHLEKGLAFYRQKKLSEDNKE